MICSIYYFVFSSFFMPHYECTWYGIALLVNPPWLWLGSIKEEKHLQVEDNTPSQEFPIHKASTSTKLTLYLNSHSKFRMTLWYSSNNRVKETPFVITWSSFNRMFQWWHLSLHAKIFVFINIIFWLFICPCVSLSTNLS